MCSHGCYYVHRHLLSLTCSVPTALLDSINIFIKATSRHDLIGQYAIRATSCYDLIGQYAIRAASRHNVIGQYAIRATSCHDLIGQYATRGTLHHNLLLGSLQFCSLLLGRAGHTLPMCGIYSACFVKPYCFLGFTQFCWERPILYLCTLTVNRNQYNGQYHILH